MHWFRTFRFSFYALFIIGIIAYYHYVQQLDTSLQNRTHTLTIPKGVGVSWLANHLKEKRIYSKSYITRLYLYFNYKKFNLKVGEYSLIDVETLPDLIAKLNKGKVKQYAITFIEGKASKDIIAKLKAQTFLKDQLTNLSDAQIMQALGKPNQHIEGQFAPQTYFYTLGMSDLDVLKLAHKKQITLIDKIWRNRSTPNQLKSPYEMLILASIIEKETGSKGERGQISGVFHNRLKIGMRLQTDPTVIYGMGERFDGNIRKKDLLTDTPYNTYTRYGLPPTPIALPGEAALYAAAHPEKTNALYFVSKGNGEHYFSSTLAEHNKAVRRYQLKK